MSLYEEIHAEVSKTLNARDADYLAEQLSSMSASEARALFAIVDNYEPSEAEQGLTPVPEAYNEQ